MRIDLAFVDLRVPEGMTAVAFHELFLDPVSRLLCEYVNLQTAAQERVSGAQFAAETGTRPHPMLALGVITTTGAQVMLHDGNHSLHKAHAFFKQLRRHDAQSIETGADEPETGLLGALLKANAFLEARGSGSACSNVVVLSASCVNTLFTSHIGAAATEQLETALKQLGARGGELLVLATVSAADLNSVGSANILPPSCLVQPHVAVSVCAHELLPSQWHTLTRPASKTVVLRLGDDDEAKLRMEIQPMLQEVPALHIEPMCSCHGLPIDQNLELKRGYRPRCPVTRNLLKLQSLPGFQVGNNCGYFTKQHKGVTADKYPGLASVSGIEQVFPSVSGGRSTLEVVQCVRLSSLNLALLWGRSWTVRASVERAHMHRFATVFEQLGRLELALVVRDVDSFEHFVLAASVVDLVSGDDLSRIVPPIRAWMQRVATREHVVNHAHSPEELYQAAQLREAIEADDGKQWNEIKGECAAVLDALQAMAVADYNPLSHSSLWHNVLGVLVSASKDAPVPGQQGRKT